MKVFLQYTVVFSLFLACAILPAGAQLTFDGSSKKVITEKVESSTGLEALYVIYDTKDVIASYTSTTGKKVTWSRFSNLGGGYAEEVACDVNGQIYSITLSNDDIGYIIDDGDKRHCYWVVNYANHYANLQGLSIDEEQECDRTRLILDGSADKIIYFTINGAAKELSRDLIIEYNTLKYDSSAEFYSQIVASQTFSSIEHTVGVFAPLCDTNFRLTGDRFLKEWKLEQSVESSLYKAIAVQAETVAEQEIRENDNEQKVDAGALGGSAPVTINFRAVVTDAAIFREWQMSNDPEFEVIDDRFQQLEFDYTFRDNGNTYVRFVANNAAGSCEWVGETYEVFVGESALLCPNVFSPNGDGVNDEWKVSYKSIIEFECHIFNRWGQEMISMTNPAQGWDGYYKGKLVPTGVYYYVIKARGSDGKKYNLNGDINIIKSKHNTTTGEETE